MKFSFIKFWVTPPKPNYTLSSAFDRPSCKMNQKMHIWSVYSKTSDPHIDMGLDAPPQTPPHTPSVKPLRIRYNWYGCGGCSVVWKVKGCLQVSALFSVETLNEALIISLQSPSFCRWWWSRVVLHLSHFAGQRHVENTTNWPPPWRSSTTRTVVVYLSSVSLSSSPSVCVSVSWSVYDARILRGPWFIHNFTPASPL